MRSTFSRAQPRRLADALVLTRPRAMSSDARVTPLRDVANTPTRVGRVVDKSAPSSGKPASRATAKTPTSRSTHQRVNEKTSTTASSRKRALESDEEIVRLISAVTDAGARDATTWTRGRRRADSHDCWRSRAVVPPRRRD